MGKRKLLTAKHYVCWLLRPPRGAEVRRGVADMMFILGVGRLGIFAVIPAQTIPNEIYGASMIVLAAALHLSSWRMRLRLSGRLVAALGAGIMAGLGFDVLPSTVSAAIPFFLAYILIGEAGTQHEC